MAWQRAALSSGKKQVRKLRKLHERLKAAPKFIHLCWLFEKFNLPIPPYFIGTADAAPQYEGCRLADSTRSWLQNEDTNHTGHTVGTDFCISVTWGSQSGNKSNSREVRLRWRNKTDAGSFADLGASGELTWSADTTLVNAAAFTTDEHGCVSSGQTNWVDGEEREGANAFTYSNLSNDSAWTGAMWAVDTDNAHEGDEYEFELYNQTDTAQIAVCSATITMAAGDLTINIDTETVTVSEPTRQGIVGSLLLEAEDTVNVTEHNVQGVVGTVIVPEIDEVITVSEDYLRAAMDRNVDREETITLYEGQQSALDDLVVDIDNEDLTVSEPTVTVSIEGGAEDLSISVSDYIYVDTLIVDGGVEYWDTSTTLTHWNEREDSTSTFEQETTDIQQGDSAVKMWCDGSGNDVGFWQTSIDLNKGDRLRLQFKWKVDNTKSWRAQLEYVGGPWYINNSYGWQQTSSWITLSGDGTWQTFDQILDPVPETASYTLQFYRAVANTTAYFDDIKLSKVPAVALDGGNLYISVSETIGVTDHPGIDPEGDYSSRIVDGGFELWDDANTLTYWGKEYGTHSQDTPAHSGSITLEHLSGGSDPYYARTKQVINLKPNTGYTWTFYYKNETGYNPRFQFYGFHGNNPQSPVHAHALRGDSTWSDNAGQYPDLTDSLGEWKRFSIRFTTEDEFVSFHAYLRDSNFSGYQATMWFDRMELVEGVSVGDDISVSESVNVAIQEPELKINVSEEIFLDGGDTTLTDGGLNVWTDANNLTNWGKTETGDGTLNREASEKVEGDYSAYLEKGMNGANHVRINQNINANITKGQKYRLSFWYKSDSGTIGIKYYLWFSGLGWHWDTATASWMDSGDLYNEIAASTSWTYYEEEFWAYDGPGETCLLDLKTTGTSINEGLYLDKIRIGKVGGDANIDGGNLYVDVDETITVTEPTVDVTIEVEGELNVNVSDTVSITEENIQGVVSDFHLSVSERVFLDGGDLMTDGGFNDWTTPTNLTHWGESTAGSSSIDREAAEVVEGDYSVALYCDSGDLVRITTASTITLTPGQNYRLRFQAKCNSGGENVYWAIRFYDSASNVYWWRTQNKWNESTAAAWEGFLTSSWQTIEVEFFAHPDYTDYYLRITEAELGTDSGTAYFDDMRLAPVGGDIALGALEVSVEEEVYVDPPCDPLDPAAAVLLLNAGFEDWTSPTDADNWTETIGLAGSVNRESTEVETGTYSCRMDIDTDYVLLRGINTGGYDAGLGYKFRIRYKMSESVKQARVWIRVNDLYWDGTEWVSYDNITLPNSTSWTWYEATFNAPPAGGVSRIDIREATGETNYSIYIDRIEIFKVPTVKIPILEVDVDETITTSEPTVNVVIAEPGNLLVDVDDTVTVSEPPGQGVVGTVILDTEDTVSVTEPNVIASISEPGALDVDVDDTVSITEPNVLGIVGTVILDTEDTIGVTEPTVSVTITEPGSLSVNVSDTVNVTEFSPQAYVGAAVSVEDTITVSEAGTVAVPTCRGEASDTITVSEPPGAGIVGTVILDADDTVSVSEVTINVVIQVPGQLYITVEDNLTVSEDLSLVVGTVILTASDTVSVSEDPTVAVQKAVDREIDVSDTLTLTEDLAARISPLSVSIDETVSVSESVSAAVPLPGVSVDETITVTEPTIKLVFAMDISVADTVAVTEPTVEAWPGHLSVDVSESITVSPVPDVYVVPTITDHYAYLDIKAYLDVDLSAKAYEETVGTVKAFEDEELDIKGEYK